jgi:hypothetical protein
MEQIPRGKEIAVLVLVAVTMFVTGTYVGVDWAAFYHPFQTRFSGYAGYSRDLLCAVIVLLIGRSCLSAKDRRFLYAAFALTLVADYFLTLENLPLPGTVIFLAVHGLLIGRHAQGLRASLAPARRARTLRLLGVSALIVFGGAGLLIWKVAPILARTGQLTLDVVYLLFLATSLWMAWSVFARSLYPRLNAWFIAIGMTLFFFCDVTVGLAVALGGTRQGLVLNDLIAFFYTPALLLLALSGFTWARPPAAGAAAARQAA